MLRRFLIYFSAFGIGCLMVYFIFFRNQDRNFWYWLPKERIISELKQYDFSYEKIDSCYLACPAFTIDTNFTRTFLSSASVDIAKSKPRENPRQYFLSNPTLEMYCTVYSKDSLVIVNYLKINNIQQNCGC